MKPHRMALWSIAAAFAAIGSPAQAELWTATFMDMGVRYTLTDLTSTAPNTTHTYRLDLDTSGYTGPSGAFLDSVNVQAWTGGSSGITGFALQGAPGGVDAWSTSNGPISSGPPGNTGCGDGTGASFACVEAKSKGAFSVANGNSYSFAFNVTAGSAASFLTLANIAEGAHVGAGYANAKGDGAGFGITGYTVTTAVPETEVYAMLLAGLAMLALAVRRRRPRAFAFA